MLSTTTTSVLISSGIVCVIKRTTGAASVSPTTTLPLRVHVLGPHLVPRPQCVRPQHAPASIAAEITTIVTAPAPPVPPAPQRRRVPCRVRVGIVVGLTTTMRAPHPRHPWLHAQLGLAVVARATSGGQLSVRCPLPRVVLTLRLHRLAMTAWLEGCLHPLVPAARALAYHRVPVAIVQAQLILTVTVPCVLKLARALAWVLVAVVQDAVSIVCVV